MQTQKPSRLLGVAVVMFGIGMVAAIALLIPAVRHTGTAPVSVLYILALGAPVGLLLGIVFALLSGRRSR
ncbi:hypothetical protein [Gordonia hydrophobica]|uniref:Integral membrane protein n=1 Tax=Gordonia hydrophobica TaxID=40516 RepID=A0ABZ2U6M4_9ACTN|nr:hypothetical protein [Gordonia hydrophobica]MBM7367495.1 NhaP-type Na+/H+ or K+/H+ antiporter [Gordonia hydrophobica]